MGWGDGVKCRADRVRGAGLLVVRGAMPLIGTEQQGHGRVGGGSSRRVTHAEAQQPTLPFGGILIVLVSLRVRRSHEVVWQAVAVGRIARAH